MWRLNNITYGFVDLRMKIFCRHQMIEARWLLYGTCTWNENKLENDQAGKPQEP